MILRNLVLPGRASTKLQYTGMDSHDQCLDREHFDQYPYPVEYVYNSRGFRDTEWPDRLEELQQAVWCVGDSFTVGIGQPWEHTWPQLLQQHIGKRVINISMDGASNDWIARRCKDIYWNVRPETMIVMWSYLHRREHADPSLGDEARRMHHVRSNYDEDMKNFQECVYALNSLPVSVTQFMIPGSAPMNSHISALENHWNTIRGIDWPIAAPKSLNELESLPESVKKELRSIYKCYEAWRCVLTEKNRDPICDSPSDFFLDRFYRFCKEQKITLIEQLDKARDGHHFDSITANWVVSTILNQ